MQQPMMNGNYFVPPQPAPANGYYGYPAAGYAPAPGYAPPPAYQPQVQLSMEISSCMVTQHKFSLDSTRKSIQGHTIIDIF